MGPTASVQMGTPLQTPSLPVGPLTVHTLSRSLETARLVRQVPMIPSGSDLKVVVC